MIERFTDLAHAEREIDAFVQRYNAECMEVASALALHRPLCPGRQGLGRDGRMTELDKVAKAIRDLHGAEGTHVRSEPIHETFRGETVWDGIVEVFAIRGHPKARTAYAWSHETDAGGRRDVGVLQLPLVMSPLDAVQASIAAQVRDNR